MIKKQKKILETIRLEYRSKKKESSNSELFYEDVNLNDVAKKYNTPVYVYSKSKIIENCKDFIKAFKKKKIQNFQVCYAMKACNNASILKIIKSCKCGIDAVSIEEIQKSIDVGFAPKDIVFSGVGKTRKEIEYAIKNKIGQINIESLEELKELIEISNQLNIKANIGIRINPDITADTNKKISTGSKTNKFGIDIIYIDKIFELIKNEKNIALLGLSIHIGSQITNLDNFEEAFSFMKKIYKFHPEFKTIDLGGGLGINYECKKNFPTKQDYVRLIAKYFSNFSGKIIIEIGRSIIGDAGIFLTKIVRMKHTKAKNFIIVDGGMNNLIRSAMYNAWHEPLLVNSAKKTGKIEKYDIVGPICESSDVFNKNVCFNSNDLFEKNYIVFLFAGAYGRSMASNYNLHDIAGEVLIDGEKTKQISKHINWKKIYEISESV